MTSCCLVFVLITWWWGGWWPPETVSSQLLLFQLSQNIGQQSTATDNRLWPTIDSKFLWQILYIHFYRLRKERRGEWWYLASWTSENIQTFRIISVVLCSGSCTWMLVQRTIHCSWDGSQVSHMAEHVKNFLFGTQSVCHPTWWGLLVTGRNMAPKMVSYSGKP